VTTYFDTPDSDLKRRGFTLRVRRAGDKRIQAVKAAGGGGVAKERGEWEWPTEKESPDLSLAAGTPRADMLPPDAEKKLRPVVVTDVVRTTRIVDANGTTIEAALDRGSIKAGKTRLPVHELELELRNGTPGALYRLALALLAATPLTVEVESKAARGYRLMDKSVPRPEKPKAVELGRKVRGVEGLRTIIANGLGHLLANQPSAVGRDAEGIHQVRVAIRRLRSALRMLEPRLERHVTALFQDELRRIGRVIGEARDWDIFCLQTLPKSFAELDDAGLAEVTRKAAEARRAAADERCGRELTASSFTALVLGLAAWGGSRAGYEASRRRQASQAAAVPASAGSARSAGPQGGEARPGAWAECAGERVAPRAQGAQEAAPWRRVRRRFLSPQSGEALFAPAEGPAEKPWRHQ
jgi:inorganic triphosphatase YgiF